MSNSSSSPLRLILSDIRSAGNVGAMLRTADACGVELVYACGLTPYPAISSDPRPPHISSNNTRAIAKTALGAEATIPILHCPDTSLAITKAREDGFTIIVVEQTDNSLNLYRYHPAGPIAIVVGNEINGISSVVTSQADVILELPMLGTKESLNVASTAAIVMYQIRFGSPS